MNDRLEVKIGQVVPDNIKGRIMEMVVFVLASFFGDLRGDEALKLVFSETRDFINEAENNHNTNTLYYPFMNDSKGREVENVFIFFCDSKKIK